MDSNNYDINGMTFTPLRNKNGEIIRTAKEVYDTYISKNDKKFSEPTTEEITLNHLIDLEYRLTCIEMGV